MSHVLKWKIVYEVGSKVVDEKVKRWKKSSRLFELWSWCVVTLQNYINYNDKLNELYKLCIISSCACLTIKTSPRLITSIKQEKETKVETNCFYSTFLKTKDVLKHGNKIPRLTFKDMKKHFNRKYVIHLKLYDFIS